MITLPIWFVAVLIGWVVTDIIQIVRKAKPKYKCRHCRDTGVLHDEHVLSVCYHCRDMGKEIREAAEKLRGLY
jgi:Zn finger protein HypA/HybF involved in hydrogenase expression